MSVDLGDIPLLEPRPVPVQFGGVQRGELGASEYVGMLGDRWAFEFATGKMNIEPDGRLLLADLTRGLREGVVVPVRQPDFDRGAPGSPQVRTATASGRTIPIKLATPNTVIRKGRWFNYFDANGRRYLDHTTAEVVVDGDGEADLPIQFLLRAPLALNALVNLADPRILGSIDGFEGGAWGLDGYTSFAFTVTEDR